MNALWLTMLQSRSYTPFHLREQNSRFLGENFVGSSIQPGSYPFSVPKLTTKEGYGEDIRPIPPIPLLVERLVESEFN